MIIKKNTHSVVTVSIISGEGKKNVTEVNSHVWLNRTALKTVNGDYHFIFDSIEMTMPSELGYEFMEDMVLFLPFKDRKKLMEMLMGCV
ncbi:hypothetical protein IPdc08_01890 [archaeon]|nr:hypothetical protein IPdc08_01890 [archaeon]